MRAFPIGVLLCLIVGMATAQTNDRARTTIGLSVGLHAGSSLWDVPNQLVPSPNARFGYGPDTYHLYRDVSYGFTLAAHATHFSSEHFGLTAEFTYLGLKTADACAVVQDGGDPELIAACAALGGGGRVGISGVAVDQSASTTLVQGGVVLRPFKPAVLQPFFKGLVGFAATPRSTVALRTIYAVPSDPGTSTGLIIYQDYSWKQVRPVFTVAAGVTTAPSSGLQLIVELRDLFLAQSIVTGPSAALGLEPPNHSVIKGFPSVLVGLEVVLKRERGRRY